MNTSKSEACAILMAWSRVCITTTMLNKYHESNRWCTTEFGGEAGNAFPRILEPNGEIVYVGGIEDSVWFSRESVWDHTRFGPKTTFFFKHEQDAVHFKLRWG